MPQSLTRIDFNSVSLLSRVAIAPSLTFSRSHYVLSGSHDVAIVIRSFAANLSLQCLPILLFDMLDSSPEPFGLFASAKVARTTYLNRNETLRACTSTRSIHRDAHIQSVRASIVRVHLFLVDSTHLSITLVGHRYTACMHIADVSKGRQDRSTKLPQSSCASPTSSSSSSGFFSHL